MKRAVTSAVQFKVSVATGNVSGMARNGARALRDTVRLASKLDQAVQALFERNARTPGLEGMLQAKPGQLLRPEFVGHGVLQQALPVLSGTQLRILDSAALQGAGICGTGIVAGAVGAAGSTAAGGPREAGALGSPAAAPTSGGAASSSTSQGAPSATDGQGLYRLFEENPAAFQEAWKGMNDSDRQMAMMQLQREMQMIQQLTTMMTNMLQTQHSATMAVARNLSV
ncbi:MAG: hypothetical protein EA398_12345 [Deltaproteobacteria bacterium]|nr:MAG: hypothetical protein EA398_12345 [Deltaproteobacteria bacterium]